MNDNDAIKYIQTKLGVTADGDFGPISMGALDHLIANQTRYATTSPATYKSPILIGLQDYGIKEVDGTASNAKILQYFKDTHNEWAKDDAVAWCAAFVGSCLERAGIVSTRSLSARSYLTFGHDTKTPKIGDIAVFTRGGNSAEGHVAFFIREENGMIYVLGGNQSNAVTIGTMPKALLLGYRTF